MRGRGGGVRRCRSSLRAVGGSGQPHQGACLRVELRSKRRHGRQVGGAARRMVTRQLRWRAWCVRVMSHHW